MILPRMVLCEMILVIICVLAYLYSSCRHPIVQFSQASAFKAAD
jgi:hypothetical protein